MINHNEEIPLVPLVDTHSKEILFYLLGSPKIDDRLQGLVEKFHINIEHVASHFTNQRTSKFYYDFQKDMLQKGYLEGCCPFSGEIKQTNDSRVHGHFYFYKFTESEYIFWVCCGLEAQGFPIQAVIIELPDVNLVFLKRNRATAHVRIKNGITLFLASLKRGIVDLNENLVKDKRKVVLCDHSFFHFFWNELSALKRIYDEGLFDEVDEMLVGNELFDLSYFFPKISHKIKYMSQKGMSERIKDPQYFLIKVGSTELHQELVDQAYQYCRQNVSSQFNNKIKVFQEQCKIIVVISIRAGMDKIWLSEVEGITKIINEMNKKWPFVGVILDGFSTTGDIDASEIIHTQELVVQEIIAQVKHPEVVWNTVGCHMIESIALSREIDFYLTTHGSQQHKWGWFGNKPGIVHGPKERMANLEAINLRSLSALKKNPCLFIGIASKHIENKGYRLPSKKVGNNADYDFDWKLAYDKIEVLMHQILANKQTKES